MRRPATLFGAGLLGGIILAGIAVWTLMPAMMLSIHPSRFGFEETVTTLKASVEDRGWLLPKEYNIQKSLQKAGHDDMTPVRILSICQPDHAHRILASDADKRVTAVMPCRIGIYEAADGKTYVASMNLGLMGRLFGGTIAEVMTEVAAEEQSILGSVIAR